MPVSLGTVRSVVGDLRDGLRRVDLRIYDGALVVEPVNGIDPVLLGRVAGTVLLGPLGFLLGGRLGRRRARRQRIARLANPSPGEAGERIPIDQLVAVTLRRFPWGGSARLGAGGGGSRTLRWAKADHAANDVAGRLQAAAPNRFSMVPFSSGLAIAYRLAVGLVILAALASIAIPVKLVAFPAAGPGDALPTPVRDALHRACPQWREAPLAGPALATTAAAVRADFEAAAAGAPEFASLAADIAAVEAFAPKARTAGAPLTEAAAFSAAVDRLDAACASAGV